MTGPTQNSMQSWKQSSPRSSTVSSLKVLPFMRMKPGAHRTVHGKLQREAARRRRMNRRLAVISVVSLLGLLALFYEILVS
jgi:hypothetical protein